MSIEIPGSCYNCSMRRTSAYYHNDPFSSVQGDSWFCEHHMKKVINQEIGYFTRELWCTRYMVDNEYHEKVSKMRGCGESF